MIESTNSPKVGRIHSKERRAVLTVLPFFGYFASLLMGRMHQGWLSVAANAAQADLPALSYAPIGSSLGRPSIGQAKNASSTPCNPPVA